MSLTVRPQAVPICAMKSAWVVLLAVGVAPVALADEPDLEELRAIGAQAVPARDAWEGCTASVVKEALRTERPAEAIADQALRRCTARASCPLLRNSDVDRRLPGQPSPKQIIPHRVCGVALATAVP